jgi:SRSO17 transposase
MGLQGSKDIESRFARYVDGLVRVIGHADRADPLRDYCLGLVMPGERKSVEPMAAITAPERTAAQHQSLLHFVGQGAWSDEEVLAKVREMVLPRIARHGPIEAWIIDDTSFPKQGRHSVGVSHQYCGQLGKQANCQVAVSLSLANHDASLPVAYRLYLPKAWAEDDCRRSKARVPELDFGQKFNGLAIVRGAKYGARQFLYCHGQAETMTKFPAASICPAKYALPRAA